MVQLQYATLSQIADELRRRATKYDSISVPTGIYTDISQSLKEMAVRLVLIYRILENKNIEL